MASDDMASDDMASDDTLADETLAARKSLEEAGISLEAAGDALEHAATEDELAAAESALAKARLSVIVAGQDLLDLREAAGDANEGDELYQAERSLDEANIAIVIATESVFLPQLELPEFRHPQAPRPEGGQLDKELDASIAIFETTIIDARNVIIGSIPVPTGAENIPGVAVLGSPGDGDFEAGAEEAGLSVPGLGENETTQTGETTVQSSEQGRMPEGGELASNKAEQGSSSPQFPDDLPNPQGDDIVARQLREAAVAATDPELQAKLWEEYKKYRAGL